MQFPYPGQRSPHQIPVSRDYDTRLSRCRYAAAVLMEAINSFHGKKTMIIIAHRLNTIEGVDNILVVNDGKIEEQGTHAQLLSRGGVYANLYGKQMQEELKDKEVSGDGE